MPINRGCNIIIFSSETVGCHFFVIYCEKASNHVFEDHIVLCYRQTTDGKKQLHLKVFDVLDGRKVRHHREPLIDSGRVEFVVRDGRLCIMQGNHVTVLK